MIILTDSLAYTDVYIGTYKGGHIDRQMDWNLDMQTNVVCNVIACYILYLSSYAYNPIDVLPILLIVSPILYWTY